MLLNALKPALSSVVAAPVNLELHPSHGRYRHRTRLRRRNPDRDRCSAEGVRPHRISIQQAGEAGDVDKGR